MKRTYGLGIILLVSASAYLVALSAALYLYGQSPVPTGTTALRLLLPTVAFAGGLGLLIRDARALSAAVRSDRAKLFNYALIDQLKNIRSTPDGWTDVLEPGTGYILVVYALRYRNMSRAGSAETARGEAMRRLERLVRSHLQGRFPRTHVLQIEHDRLVSLVPNAGWESVTSWMNELGRKLDAELPGCPVKVAVSVPIARSEELHAAYAQALEWIEQGRLTDKAEIIDGPSEVPAISNSLKRHKSLNATLESGHAERACEAIDYMLEDMHKKDARICQYDELAHIVMAKARIVLASVRLQDGQADEVERICDRLAGCCTLEDYKAVYRDLFRSVAASIYVSADETDDIAAFVMDYLHKKYANQELSLSHLADLLNMSSVYLSTYIKEKTGGNFIDHLNKIRVEKAQELLVTTELTIHDVAREVGYANITSFGRMFKKNTGLSPGDYRKRHIIEIHHA